MKKLELPGGVDVNLHPPISSGSVHNCLISRKKKPKMCARPLFPSALLFCKALYWFFSGPRNQDTIRGMRLTL
jgi:hypothetical protein